MELNPSSKANSHSAGQEIPRLLWNPEFHYCFHRPLAPALSQLNPPYSPKIHSKIIFPSTRSFSEWTLLQVFDQIFVRLSHKEKKSDALCNTS